MGRKGCWDCVPEGPLFAFCLAWLIAALMSILKGCEGG